MRGGPSPSAANNTESAGSGGLATERLQQRAGALEALREAFQSVASESGAAAEDGGDPDGSPFAMLREPSDALLFRPGHAPRLFHQGRWRDSGTQVLDPAAYDQLRARLLDGAAGAGAQSRSTGVHTLVVPHEDGRYVVTRVGGAHEALWVRAAGVTPAEPLEGPMDALHALLEMPSGLVIVGGPDGESADRFLHACVAELTHRRASTVLLAADHGRWQHEDGAGALVRVTDTDLEAMLRTLAPEVAVFDHAHAHASLAALPVAPLVLVSVVAPDAQALVSRWCARVGRRWGDGIETQLAVAPLGIGFAAGVRQSGGRIVFAAAPLSFAQPAQAAVIAPTPTPATVDAASGAEPEPAPANAALAPAAPSVAVTAPIVPTLPPASAAPEAPEAAADATAPVDSMAALAAELTRTLHKAA